MNVNKTRDKIKVLLENTLSLKGLIEIHANELELYDFDTSLWQARDHANELIKELQNSIKELSE